MSGYWNADSDRDWQDQCGMYDEPEEEGESEMEHDTENCPGGADCPYSCPSKAMTHRDWDVIRTALHMAAHEYLATCRDCRGIGSEAERCAAMRNRISRLLPRVEGLLIAAQNAELAAR